MNKKFSIPYNPKVLSDTELREQYFSFLDRNKDYIKDIYFGYHIHPFMTDSRSGHFESSNDAILSDIHKIYLQMGIPGSPTFNGHAKHKGLNDYKSFVYSMRKIENQGIKSMTLNAPLWVTKIKKDLPNIKVKNTVVVPIGHPQELAHYYEELEYDILYIREDLIKDRDTLILDLKVRDKYKKEIAILMNHECCISYCPAKKTHYEYANDFQNSFLFSKFCTDKETADMPSWYKRTYVFPLRSHYQWFFDNFDYLKMAGRTVVADLIETMEIVDTFVNTENEVLFKNWFQRLLNNIKDISTVKEFISHHINCKNMCCLCGYCDKMIKPVLDNEKMFYSKS